MFLHGDVAVVVIGVEECVADAARLIAEVGDQRAAIPRPFVCGACAQTNVHRLPARVVMDVVIKRRRCAKAFAFDLPLSVEQKFVGVRALNAVADVAAEAVDATGVVLGSEPAFAFQSEAIQEAEHYG